MAPDDRDRSTHSIHVPASAALPIARAKNEPYIARCPRASSLTHTHGHAILPPAQCSLIPTPMQLVCADRAHPTTICTPFSVPPTSTLALFYAQKSDSRPDAASDPGRSSFLPSTGPLGLGIQASLTHRLSIALPSCQVAVLSISRCAGCAVYPIVAAVSPHCHTSLS